MTQLETFEITHSPRGRRLHAPLVLTLPKPETPREQSLINYVIDALSWKMPALVKFTLMNQSCRMLAQYLQRHNTGSTATLYQYIYGVHRFCSWIQKAPDQLISECKTSDDLPEPRNLSLQVKALDDFVGDLQAGGLAPGTISNHVKGVKALFRVNGLKLELPYRLSKRVIYSDRSPRPEELQSLIDLADLRDKVIVALLALGGFREGTLVRLCYRHVADDLERGVVPPHVHVEAEITKGKYADYDVFLGAEAVEYLRLYLAQRQAGSPELRTPPEKIIMESPLIRNTHSALVKPVSPSRVHSIIHNLYREAGLLKSQNGRRYELRVHSIRKYFRTQMAALGVNQDYIEYMMGHKISTYHDVKMKGIEFLRNIYAASGLSIRPKTRVSKIEALKEIIRAWGMDPEEVLTKKALAEPHRVYV
ncbi:site-specific integrase, partial [Candidatus Bathyarchaeota archaeon]|nr:site-specific integrase [Candidatus Bathyarchaeota archaeon]